MAYKKYFGNNYSDFRRHIKCKMFTLIGGDNSVLFVSIVRNENVKCFVNK